MSPERAPSYLSPTDTSDKDLTTSLDAQPSHIAVTKVTANVVCMCMCAYCMLESLCSLCLPACVYVCVRACVCVSDTRCW